MYFETVMDCPTREGELLYFEKDQFIDFVPHQGGGYNLVLGYLNLIFASDTKCAKQVWGLHSHTIWIPQRLRIPDFQPGSFLFEDETIDEDDVAVEIENTSNWQTFYDKQTKWMCFGDSNEEEDDISIEFATNCVAVLHHKQLKALWLKPTLRP